MPNSNDDTNVETISRIAVKLPPVWKNNISVWFVQAEANFEVAQITNDTTKYNYILSSIDTETLNAVTDIILNPPANEKYKTLKERLIQEFSDTQSQQIRKLLSELTLGDKKPSVLLRQMKELATNSVTDEFLKAIWLERLPSQTQAILSVSTASLSELATLADKINEIKSENQIYAVSNPENSTQASQNEISKLQNQIDQLSIQISELTKSVSRRSNSRGRYHNRSRSYSRNRSYQNTTQQSQYCYFHSKFGKNAKKCYKPCSYEENQKN